MKSWRIWMLSPKGKLFPFISSITSECFINFGGWEGHLFEFWSWGTGENLINPKISRARMSVTHLATCACPRLLLYPYLLRLAACVASRPLALLCTAVGKIRGSCPLARLLLSIASVRNRTLTLIKREDNTRSWGNFLVYFSHSTTMPCPPRGWGYILIGC
jgi:hypothetical protein